AAAHDAEIDLGLRKAGIFAGDAQVAGHRKLIAAAQAKAIDHCYDGFGKGIDRIEKRPFEKRISLSDRRLPLEFINIRPGDESLLASTGDDEHANGIVLTQIVERRDAFRVNFIVKRVELVRTVDGQHSDLAALFDGDRFVNGHNEIL